VWFKFLFIIVAALLSSSVAYAENAYNWDRFNANLALGYLNAEMKEYVYDPDSGRKISELDWDINRATILRGEISYALPPYLTIGVGGWTNIPTLDSNRLDDYDWDHPGQSSPTDHSWHPNTKLFHAHALDLNLKGWVLTKQHYRFAMMAGYEYSSINMQFRGGSYFL